MNSENLQKNCRDRATDGVMAALRRARLRAEREALMTGTSLVVLVDGEIVHVPPRSEAAIRADEISLQTGGTNHA